MDEAMGSRWEQTPQYSLAGNLLVASPNWQHELFSRAVCLVVHHSPERAIGVVLNRNFEFPASGLFEKLAGDKPLTVRAAINLGGPQSGPVVALHEQQELAEYSTGDGVYFAAQVQHLQQLVTSPSVNSRVKIIVGQADWSAGELDREFSQGKWLPLPVSPSLVFADDSEMWERALRKVGDLFVSQITGAPVQTVDVLTN